MQRVIRIFQRRLQRHVARDRIHHGINRSQFPFEQPARERVGAHGYLQIFRQLREILVGQRKIDVDRIKRGQPDHLLTCVDHLADVHLANTKLSIERGGNVFFAMLERI